VSSIATGNINPITGTDIRTEEYVAVKKIDLKTKSCTEMKKQ
jgi:hypothetical protein